MGESPDILKLVRAVKNRKRSKTRANEATTNLIDKYAGFVLREYRRVRNWISLEDWQALAALTLLKCCDSFKPGKVKFLTFYGRSLFYAARQLWSQQQRSCDVVSVDGMTLNYVPDRQHPYDTSEVDEILAGLANVMPAEEHELLTAYIGCGGSYRGAAKLIGSRQSVVKWWIEQIGQRYGDKVTELLRTK